MKYNLTIDARMIKHSGIGTYTKNMIAAIADNYNLTLLGNYDILNSFPWSKKVKTITANSPIYSLSEQMELPKKIPPCDLFISPHYNVPLKKIKALRGAYAALSHGNAQAIQGQVRLSLPDGMPAPYPPVS